jgi:Aromatic-ring-opening dioxygenase LigAB, LigA subunit
MSSYHLNRFLFDLKMDDEALRRAAGDLDRALGRYELTAEEKQAIKQGDPRRLRQLGAHGMLALYILRLNPEFERNIYWSQK